MSSSLGHTHIPFTDKSYTENSKEMWMINPGSLGQPRDGDSRTSYSTADLKEFSAEIIRVTYDIDEAYARVLESRLPESLGKRLYNGE